MTVVGVKFYLLEGPASLGLAVVSLSCQPIGLLRVAYIILFLGGLGMVRLSSSWCELKLTVESRDFDPYLLKSENFYKLV